MRCAILWMLLAGLVMLSGACRSQLAVDRDLVSVDAFDENVPRSSQLRRASELKSKSPYLKAHMKDGSIYVLEGWQIEIEDRLITGSGTHYGPNRKLIAEGAALIALDSVAIIETNQVHAPGTVASLAVVTGISVAVTAYCASNPKACFGSCPTFYVNIGDSLMLQAEGFSSSIAPSLEDRDLDVLFHASSNESALMVEMRNEALETHVVRYVNVLALPNGGSRVFKDLNGQFWSSSSIRQPTSCRAAEGSCLDEVLRFDSSERFSLADSVDLAARETIDLTFNLDSAGEPDRARGVVVAARQSLLSTYVLYQALAYMGHDVGSWLARLERNGGYLPNGGIADILGKIEVQIRDEGERWKTVGSVGEHGPLATDATVVRLPRGATGSEVRLRMTKGNWRLDFVALAELGDRVDPIVLRPSSVSRDGVNEPHALELLLSQDESLTTLPGDTYQLHFDVPPGLGPLDFFLESKGYYLEWMREEWMSEENASALMQLLVNPAAAMKTMAPQFKRAEPFMEDAFWRSRYAKH